MMPIWSMIRANTGIGVGFRKRLLPLQKGMFRRSPSWSWELQGKDEVLRATQLSLPTGVSCQRAETPLRGLQRAILERI